MHSERKIERSEKNNSGTNLIECTCFLWVIFGKRPAYMAWNHPCPQFAGTLTLFYTVLAPEWIVDFGANSNFRQLSADNAMRIPWNLMYLFFSSPWFLCAWKGRSEMYYSCDYTWGMGRIWNAWGNKENFDVIETWNLYQNDTLISKEGTQSIQIEGTQEIFFEQRYPHMESIKGLSLVPVFSRSGEHTDEAICIEKSLIMLNNTDSRKVYHPVGVRVPCLCAVICIGSRAGAKLARKQ